MAIAEAMAGPPTAGSVTDIERLLAEHIRLFCAQCDIVIRRGYREIIRGGAPTPDLVERHRRDLHWALRSARLYNRLTSSQDFADRSLAELIEAKMRQLEEHWKYIYERPSQEETEKLQKMIQEMFPDESRACSFSF